MCVCVCLVRWRNLLPPEYEYKSIESRVVISRAEECTVKGGAGIKGTIRNWFCSPLKGFARSQKERQTALGGKEGAISYVTPESNVSVRQD